MGPSFQRRVTGIGLFDYLAWVQASNVSTPLIPNPLTLSPAQRSVPWRPRQILDFWRSLFAGMPVGAFYLSPPCRHRRLIGYGANQTYTTESIPEDMGYDLLDGHQRTYALMLALLSPALAGKCIWIAPDTGSDGIAVHLTTRSQPFGLTKDGEKLRGNERKTARHALEADHGGRDGMLKDVADHALYEWNVERSPGGWPPPPFLPGAVMEPLLPVAPVHALVAALRVGSPDGTPVEQRLASVFDILSVSAGDTSARRRITPGEVAAVRHALAALEDAELAMILASPQPKPNGDLDPDWTLTLFDRIGAGGTPLSGAERLFSIYKHHVPYVHDAVMRIGYGRGGIMASADIALTAISIAAARHPTRPRFAPPDAREFTSWMKGSGTEHKDFQECLRSLIEPRWAKGPGGTLYPAFARVDRLLTDKDNPRRLPALLAASLPPELMRTLVHWAVLNDDRPAVTAIDAAARDDVIRFALFWQLCVTNPDKAAWQAARCLSQGARTSDPDTAFPWRPLMEALFGEDPSAVELVHPRLIEEYGKHRPSPKLRGWNERFARTTEGPRSELIAQSLFQRWWKATGILLWLQRDYLAREFGGYDPASEREEEKPVDLDHIQPKAAFAFDFVSEAGKFEETVAPDLRKAFREGRWQLGDSIGNHRWVSSSVGRADGDCPVSEKLSPDAAVPAAPRGPSLAECRIDVASSTLWERASGPPDGRWTADRIQAWQQAVEERAVWLYAEFWREAGFDAWFGDLSAPNPARPATDEA